MRVSMASGMPCAAVTNRSATTAERRPGSSVTKAVSRMTARSVVLSVLLGAHPAWATAGELLRLTADFELKEPTVRVALTRMVSSGDLVRSEDGYRLSDRLLARQRRQDGAINPRTRRWDGAWTTLIITSVGSDARTRAALRNTLQDWRFGELREGVWLRPANLDVELSAEVLDRVRVLHARDDDPAGLAGRLWDLPGWVRVGDSLLEEMAAASDIPDRFVAAAGNRPAPDHRSGAARRTAARTVARCGIAQGLQRLRRGTGSAARRDRIDGGDDRVGTAGRSEATGDRVRRAESRVEKSGPVTTVIMNRPAARNAVNGPAGSRAVRGVRRIRQG